MINKLKKLAYFLNEIVKPEQNTQEENKDESASETNKTATTHRNLIIVFAILLATMTSSCSKPKLTQEPESLQEPSVEATFPTICLYTLGDVRPKLRKAIMDSLQCHYPKCRFERNIPLPQCAITKKRHDHIRYISDSLNVYLAQYKTDSTIVVGLTSADIGKDNFRGRAHSGIMGEAKGINVPVAVFSSYRPRNNTQLFSVMLHEIGHATGLRHCPDTNCIMQNANGGNPFNRTNHFCCKCKKHMESKGWKLEWSKGICRRMDSVPQKQVS